MRSLIGFLVVLGAACGDDGVGKLPDAPLGPDAPNGPDAPTAGVVTLTITSDTTPIPAVKVYFQNADSSVVAATVTDVNGVAMATMEPGGFVTAIDPFRNIPLPTGIALPNDLRTFAAVKPGDHLVLHQDTGAVVNITNVTLTIPLDVSVISYFLDTNCGQYNITGGGGSGSGSGNPGGPVALFGCGATTDLVLEGFDGGGNSILSIAKSNVALVEGGTIDLTADTYTATTNVAWSYSNVPAGIGSINVDSLLATSRGALLFSPTQGAVVNAGAATMGPVLQPVVAGATQINVSRFFGGAFGNHSVVDWGPAAATHPLDMTSLLLPDYTDLATFDATNHKAVWPVNAAGAAAPDFAIVSAFFDRQTGTLLQWSWDLVAPDTASSVTFPVLPSTDPQFNPLTSDVASINRVTTAKVPGGYDTVRANALAFDVNVPENIAQGAAGRVVVEEFTGGVGRRTAPTTRRALRPWQQARAHR